LETTSLTRIKVQLTDPSLKAQFFPLCLEVTVYMSLPSYKIFSIGSDKADLETHGIENQSGKGENFKHGCCMYKLVMSKSLAVWQKKSFVSELKIHFQVLHRQIFLNGYQNHWLTYDKKLFVSEWTNHFQVLHSHIFLMDVKTHCLYIWKKIICFWTNNSFSSFAWPHISKWILD